MFSHFTAIAQPLGTVKPFTLSDQTTKAGQGKKLCLVSDSRHSRVPSAHQAACWFAADGWDVTLLDLSVFDGVPEQPASADRAPDAGRPYHYVRLRGRYGERNGYLPLLALSAYHWLRQEQFDLIVLQHGFGAGVCCVRARRLGLAFAATPVVVMGDYPFARWMEEHDFVPEYPRTDGEIDYLERETLVRADALLLTDSEALPWLQAAGWQIPNTVAQVGNGKQTFGAWLSHLPTKLPAASQPLPKISVCVRAERPRSLPKFIDFMQAQSVQDFELVVVDTNPASSPIAKLQQDFADLFATRRWQWLKLASGATADLHNHAAKAATGTHLLFLDDDDEPTTDMVALFGQAAQRSDAAFLSSITGWNVVNDNALIAFAKVPGRAGAKHDAFQIAWVPYGACLTSNLEANVLGEIVLYRRDEFLAQGGFDASNGLFPAWGFLTRAVLRGLELDVMPEVVALFARNKQRYGMFSPEIYQSHLSVVRDMARACPPGLAPLLMGGAKTFLNGKKTNPGQIQDRINLPKPQPSVPQAFSSPWTGTAPQVVFCASDVFIRPLAVTIASLFSSSPQAEVHVLSTFSADSVARMEKLGRHFGRSINIVQVSAEMIASLPAGNLWGLGESTATYWRLFLPNYLPQLKRVIYLDSDVLVRRDVQELWETDLHGNILGAARESAFPPGGGIYRALMGRVGGDYFNAGVLLIDLAKWQDCKMVDEVLRWSKRLEQEQEQYKFGDQTPLNRAVAGRWQVLSPTWNFSQWNPERLYPEAQGINKLDPNQYVKLFKNPGIVHFLGGEKPWHTYGYPSNNFTAEYRAVMQMVDSICGF